MTEIPATCSQCGLHFSNNQLIWVGPDAQVSISDVATRCPRCGALAFIEDGTYNYFGKVLDAFKAVETAQVEAFQLIVAAAVTGSLSAYEAKIKSEEIHSGFGSIISTTLKLGIPALLVALISLYLQWNDSQSNDRSSEAFLNAVRGLRQTDAALVLDFEKIDRVNNTHELQRYSAQRLNTNPGQDPSKTIARTNRHTRRKAAPLMKDDKKPND